MKPITPKHLKEKKRVEFSQKLVVTSWAVTIVWITMSFILAFYDKNTNSEVTVVLVKESFGVTLAYFIYQAALKISRNISKVDENGIPYRVKSKLDGVLNSTSSDLEEVDSYEQQPLG